MKAKYSARVLMLFCLAAALWGFRPARAVDFSVSCDTVMVQGGIMRVDVRSASALDTVTGSFLGSELPFIRTGPGSFYALAGADMDHDPGIFSLAVSVRDAAGETSSARKRISLRDAGFPVQELTLPPKKVFPDSAAMARINRETRLRNRKWAQWADRPFWEGGFIQPVEGELRRFGHRRIINGAPRSPHSGVDIRASTGTPVKAPAAGRVLLTGDFFFSGRSVYIDHGYGLVDMFFHLDRIDVQEGDIVRRGQVIGTVGSTGRVTGPHLHWGLRWRNARINPRAVLDLELDQP